MTGDVPDLDEFLAATRRVSSCDICTLVAPEIRRKIKAKVDEGITAWAAFGRYLKACGYDMTTAKLKRHIDQGHSDE